jgi:CheY-like chemotaxis protein
VVTAHTGADGLAILREGHVGLLLLDLKLPDMDGTRVMEEVLKLAGPPDIVYVTGEASLDSAIKAVEGGTAGYVLKPVDPKRLDAIVRRIWERRRLLRENARLQAEMESRLRETEAVLAIAHTASTTLDVQEALRRICRELTRLVGADTGAAYLLDPAGRRLVPCAGYRVPKDMLATFLAFPLPLGATGLLNVEAAGIRLLEGGDLVVGARTRAAARVMARPRIRVGESLSGDVVATGRAVMVENLQNDCPASLGATSAARASGVGDSRFPRSRAGRASPEVSGRPGGLG